MSAVIIGKHLFVAGTRHARLLNVCSFSRTSGQARTALLSSSENTKIHWRAVHCKGDESDLLQCPKITWSGGECPVVAAVTCTQQPGCHHTLGTFMNMKPDLKLKHSRFGLHECRVDSFVQ